MKDEKGAALLLESVFILPMVLLIIIFMYFSTVYIVQKNIVFSNAYHYSRIATKLAVKPHIMQSLNSDFNIDANHYNKVFEKANPYAAIKQKDLHVKPLQQYIVSQVNKNNVITVEQVNVKIQKQNRGFLLPKMTIHIHYSMPILELLSPLTSEFYTSNSISEGFVTQAPIINYSKFKDNVQFVGELSKKVEKTKLGQKLNEILTKINYFLNKLK